MIEEKLKTLQDTVRLNLNSHKLNDALDEKMDTISKEIKATIVAKQKDYEQQYNLLEKKYHKLKEVQEEQFFKFTNIISSYQMLIFKIMNSQTADEEYQKINELMRAVNTTSAPTPTYSQPTSAPTSVHTPVHTPHPNNTVLPRRHNSAVGFRLNIPKRTEEEILSESDYQ